MTNRIIKTASLFALLASVLDNSAYSNSNLTTKTTLKPRIANLFNESAAASLGGTAVDANGNILTTDASFFGELNAGNILFAGGQLPNNPAIDVSARMKVDPKEVGQSAEILFVAHYNDVWFMKTPLGWQPWSQQLSSLVATGAPHALADSEDFDVVTQLTLPGNFDIYGNCQCSCRLGG